MDQNDFDIFDDQHLFQNIKQKVQNSKSAQKPQSQKGQEKKDYHKILYNHYQDDYSSSPK